MSRANDLEKLRRRLKNLTEIQPIVAPLQAPQPPQPRSAEPKAISFRMPLRRPGRSRWMTTGRDRQINIKATSDVIDRMQNLADDLNMPLGELLEHAIDYLEEHPPAAKRRR